MRKAFSFIIAMTLIAGLVFLGTVVYAAPGEITLSADDSLADALEQIADGGTVRVDGTVAVTQALGAHNKTVTITGGTLDFTGISGNVQLGDHITFDNITLTFTENTQLYANGYKVTMGNGVTMTNPIKIFGGRNGGTVASTELTLLGGKYSEIYGGGYNGNVIGDTHLYVGGNVNAGADVSNHARTHVIYGGGYISGGHTVIIGGTAYTEFTGNARANYLYGGNYGSGTIYGGTDIVVSGGATMAVYGANGSGDYNGDAKLLVSGGNMEQVFGGSEGGSVNGNVALDITGGTITRRVYGGCYNEYGGSWNTSRCVNGEIFLTLHSGANITYTATDSDRALYAHSRHSSPAAAEISHLVYADSTAYNAYKNKVKAQDTTMKYIMSGVSAADYIHYHTYSASGAAITQNCIDSKCSASATVAVEGTPIFSGSAVEPAEVIYTGSWFGDELEIAYANNNAVGTGTASITYSGATASVDFAIVPPSLRLNGEGYGSLEEAVAAARKTPEADTIVLEQDLELSSWLVIDTDVTLTADKAVAITAADSQTGSMIRVIDGTLTITGDSEDAKITLAAGVNTANVIFNDGGNVELTNVRLVGNENTTYTRNNKACGIFNYKGTTTAKSVDIQDMVMGDGIYVMADTTVNLDNVTVSGSGRYGIKVKGTLNIANTVDKDHALSVSGCTDYAIDVENGGKVTCDFQNVSADAVIVKLFDKGLNVREGGDADLSCVSDEA